MPARPVDEGPRISDRFLLEEADAIAAVLASAVRDALAEHGRRGNLVATWEDGRVVEVPAAELLARIDATGGR